MNLLLGDKVRFLNENLEGTVTSLKAQGLVGVTIEDDFEITVQAREIVVVERNVLQTSEHKSVAVAEPPKVVQGLKPGLYWVITEEAGQFHVQMTNTCSYPYLFTVYRKGITAIELVAEGHLSSMEYRTLAHTKGREPEKWGQFDAFFLPLRNLPSTLPQPLKSTLELQAQDLSKPATKLGEKPAWILDMNARKAELQTEKTVPEPKTKEGQQLPAAPNLEKPAGVVDLHAQALGLEGLDGDAILKAQMETFHRNLELAIAWQMPSIVFIHGVGSGVLKNLVYLAVRGHKHIRTYREADHARYGYGALQIDLKNT
ncbi:MAG: Smr/MutS family protein [Bacteroidetes bacterium]|nr:Smr/MutS family protein [Bacteroidota bacterium]